MRFSHVHALYCSLLVALSQAWVQTALPGMRGRTWKAAMDEDVLLAVTRDEAALFDRSSWGVLSVSGEDRLRFLHGQSTNMMENKIPGACLPTCFVSKTGRMMDFCDTLVLEDQVLLLCSPGCAAALAENLDKYIFPLDKVEVSDVSETMRAFSVAGPKAESVLGPVAGELGQHLPIGTQEVVSWPVGDAGKAHVFHRDGLKLGGYTLLCTAEAGEVLEEMLLKGGSQVLGRPSVGKELTQEYNPLEAGLFAAVHFDKGCYIGQETVAKVNLLGAPRQGLWGLELAESEHQVQEGEELRLAGDDSTGKVIGKLTSLGKGEKRGLAYISKRAGGARLKVATPSGVEATTVEIPFPGRSDADSACPPKQKDKDDAEAMAKGGAAAKREAEAARKAAKLEAMQKKVEAAMKKRSQQKKSSG